MNAWSNLEISPQDTEIFRIDQFEEQLGELSQQVYKVRELITRFEVCHFKYKRHIQNIIDSIQKLKVDFNPDEIGSHHIQQGKQAWKEDVTGKSLLGQQYLWAIQQWLNETSESKHSANFDETLGLKVRQWLGEKSAEKVSLVKLLLARLTWDWKSYEELMKGDEFKELKYQIARMDICHYAFPENLDRMLLGIGILKPMEKFEGCGTYNAEIQQYIKEKLELLNLQFRKLCRNEESDKQRLTKVWLFACLIKTLKELAGLSEPVIEF